MKKLPSLSILSLLILFSSCNINPDNSGTGLYSEGLSADANARSISQANGIKVSFRSSDIEFWASGGDFSNLMSVKYSDGEDHDMDLDPTLEATKNISTEIILSDRENNMIFMPNHINFGDAYTLPVFPQGKYDAVRIDIGSGNINYSTAIADLNIKSGTFDGKLDCNSIILIDETILSEIYYVSRSDFGNPTGSAFLNDLIDDISGVVDADGALFIPFTPIEISGDVSNLKVRVKWDMDDIFSLIEGDTYTLNNNADGTPYDFDISIEVN